jgi:pseudaminic acid biosynthesis-associated methylase
MMNSDSDAEPTRLERLWSGEFGDAYVDRNLGSYATRQPFWQTMIGQLAPQRVLEVGCNVGGNLRWIAPQLTPGNSYGVDINRKALSTLRESLPDVNALYSPARELPFRDNWFDLVLTMGVLIHQPESSLHDVMTEMARCSSRYILCGEYFAPETTPVPYRGVPGSLFKRDYGKDFMQAVPDLSLVSTGFLGSDEGWDDVTWWLFEKPGMPAE